jgi:hypothetical protein
MPNNDPIGSKPADRSDWNSAWEVVSQLAAARETALLGIGGDQQAAAILESARRQRNVSAATISAKPVVPMDPDQLARAIAEIEKASAALRRSEPALEVWLPDSATRRESRKYLSVWILIGGIWISATLVVAGATGAILYVFG